jgi:hypothetical protein
LACPTLPSTLQNGLVGYWPFCGNANDASGNGNNGIRLMKPFLNTGGSGGGSSNSNPGGNGGSGGIGCGGGGGGAGTTGGRGGNGGDGMVAIICW